MRDFADKLPPKSQRAIDEVLRIAIYAIGGYLVVKAFQAVTFVGELPQKSLAALNSVGGALGSGLFNILHPDTTGEMLYYIITFPDGKRHAIGSLTVNADGQFSYAGARYQMLVGKDGMRYAAKL